uniref:Uncharacterized protein n=2 Tax=Oryza sativa subsp. japonica TaxID=39947 RepID=Q2R6Q1_ORYSJ|nr:hypothetical protein LOC_Os11g19270 [Oryza sativa Japonica Group]ABA92802.1 hypothetical protein LOC_Os11g19270 [Oryza sativa Japonica Group]
MAAPREGEGMRVHGGEHCWPEERGMVELTGERGRRVPMLRNGDQPVAERLIGD